MHSPPSLLAWVAFAIVIHDMAGPHLSLAQSPDVLRGLHLNQVQLEIVAPIELHDRLLTQIRSRLSDAGRPLPDPMESHSARPITLNLTFFSQPLHDLCQDKALQALSFSVIEPVVILRSGVARRDQTWSVGGAFHVRTPLSTAELEQTVTRLLDRFLDQYARANSVPSGPLNQSDREHLPPIPVDLPDARSNTGLRDLSFDDMRLSVLANRSVRTLTRRAYDRLAEANIPITRDERHDAAVTLDVELLEQPLDGECPGHVLYEAGLFLVEEVRLGRAPDIRLWTDTWTRQSVRVVPPVSETQLGLDQDALLAEFLQALKARDVPGSGP